MATLVASTDIENPGFSEAAPEANASPKAKPKGNNNIVQQRPKSGHKHGEGEGRGRGAPALESTTARSHRTVSPHWATHHPYPQPSVVSSSDAHAHVVRGGAGNGGGQAEGEGGGEGEEEGDRSGQEASEESNHEGT